MIVLAVIFTAYLVVTMLRRISAVVLKDTYISVFRYELAIGAVFLLFALDVRFGIFTRIDSKPMKVVGWILRAIVIVATAVLLFFFGKITVSSLVSTAAPAPNALVLGLALENGKPVPDLISRLDTAEAYIRDNPQAMLILTGGNPDASGKTEAGVMHDILAGAWRG